MSNSNEISPTELSPDRIVVPFDATKQTVVCGLLQYVNDENGHFHFRGIANGSLTVVFSEGGRVVSSGDDQIFTGAYYHYDTKNYRYQLGFACK